MTVPMKALILIAAVLGVVAGQAFTIFNEEDDTKHPDCHSLYKAGYVNNGTYRLTLRGQEFLVPCEFRDGYGFTIFLRRIDGVVDWERKFHEYENGFGFPIHDYFSGLYALHLLTYNGNTVLDTSFQDWDGTVHYAINGRFTVNDRSTGYKLYVGGDFTGTVKNDMIYNSGKQFYTLERPDPRNCVDQQRGGWWYDYCTKTLPTGHYYNHGTYYTNKTLGDGIYWSDYKGALYSLKRFVMAVRRPL